MKALKKSLAVILSLFLCFSFIIPAYAEEEVKKEKSGENSKIAVIDEIVTSYNNPNGRILCAAKYGNPRLYPADSLEGIQSCIDMGVDIVTVSVQETKDKKLVLLESSSLKNMCVNKSDNTSTSGNVKDYTLEELQEKFFLRSGYGGSNSKPTKYTVASLEDAITTCKDSMMLMINNGWKYSDEINHLARSLGACDIIIIRNVPSPEDAAEFIDKVGLPTCHLSTIYNNNTDGSPKKFVSNTLETGAKMVELASEKSYSSIFNNSVLSRFKNAGRAFISTTEPNLCGGRDDLIVGWTDLIERGYSVIETDYPNELVTYIKEIESYRAELTSLITQAQGLNSSKFTKETAEVLDNALKEAEEISSVGCISLTQIDKAHYDIQEAIDALQIKTGTEKSGLPAWAIVLIVIACILVAAIIAIFVLRFINKKKAEKRRLANRFKNEAPEENNHLKGISNADNNPPVSEKTPTETKDNTTNKDTTPTDRIDKQQEK